MRTLMIMIGLPASGKSDLSKKLVLSEPGRWKRVSKDDLRLMFDVGEYNDENERFIQNVQDDMIRSSLKDGYDVVVDNTNLKGMARKRNHDIAKAFGDVKVVEKVLHVDPDECVRRNETRVARVPPDVITNMYKKYGSFLNKAPPSKEFYYPPKPSAMTLEQDAKLPQAIMCDLDGTLALIGDRSPYDATDCDVKDKPNWPVIRTVLAMHRRGFNIIFMSGRDQKYRPETQRFIEKYCRVPNEWAFSKENDDRPIDSPIPYQLYMRGETNPNPEKADMRKDAIIKQELFDKYVAGKFNVLYVLDDRDQVVEFWRSIGLVCFQVAPGAF